MLAKMLYPKQNHSLALVRSYAYYIYTIGGNTGFQLRLCERYDSLHNRWLRVSNLLKTRRRAATYVHNNQFIYVFAGDGTISLVAIIAPHLSCIERLDVADEEQGWMDVTPRMSSTIAKAKISRFLEFIPQNSIHPMYPNTIIILGTSEYFGTWDLLRPNMVIKSYTGKGPVDSFATLATLADKGFIYGFNHGHEVTVYSYAKMKWLRSKRF